MPAPDYEDLYYGYPGVMGCALATLGAYAPEMGKREYGQALSTLGAMAVDSKQFCDLWLPNTASWSGERPVVIFSHGKDSDKQASGVLNNFLPSLKMIGVIVVACNYLQCNNPDEQGITPSQAEYWELFADRAAQCRRAIKWYLEEFSLTDYTTDFTAGNLFIAGSSMGGTLCMYGVLGDPSDPLGIPECEDLDSITAIFDLWSSLADPETGSVLLEYNPNTQYFRSTDPPIDVIHGTEDNDPYTPPETGQAIYDSAIAAGLTESELDWLEGAGHGDWKAFAAQIQEAFDEFIYKFEEPEPPETPLDARMVPLANILAQKVGEAAVIHHESPGTYDPATRSVSEEAEDTETCYATPPMPYKLGFVAGDVTRRGDMETYVPAEALSQAPRVGAKIEINDQTWRIVAVNRVWSGERVALYQLRLR